MAYFSGQGKLYAAVRDAVTGLPGGFRFLGNVPTIELKTTVDKFEHTESMSGARGIDATLIKKKTGTISMTLEDISIDNLAMVMWGEVATVTAGSVSAEEFDAILGERVALAHINITTVSAPVIKGTGTNSSTTYEFGSSPSAAGSKNGYYDATFGAVYVWPTATQTANGAAANIADGDTLTVAYSYAASSTVVAFTESSMERYLRFEGINTMDDNAACVVDIPRASIDPLGSLSLINTELLQLEASGSILYDDLTTGTNKYFRVRMV